jgi:hypothetical protein
MRGFRTFVTTTIGVAAIVAVAAPTTPAGAVPVNRPADPVVLTGATVASLVGANPKTVVGFARTATAWRQIPIQIDERTVLNFGRVYKSTPGNVNVLGYADKNTYAGADSNRKLDADDEIAFMARDAGLAAGAASPPAATKAGTGVQVRITDPLVPGSESYVYLFRRKGGTLQPGAGRHYVQYSFNLLSGNYKKTYKLQDGPNPENSLAVGAYYRHHFSDRWTSDSIQVTAPGSSGVDVLDRHKALFAPGNCTRSENTFNDQEGAFITNKVGPVRAIRSYIGANSGPNTQREHVFYDRREDIRTYLRVHAIPSIMDFMDYSGAASGMTYRNELNQGGVTIDGTPETPAAGAPTWEQVTGAPGSITTVAQLQTTFALSGLTSYYLDDSTPPVTQCTGDAAAIGSSGLWVQGSIPCTDPQLGCAHRLTGTRIMYFGPPGATAAGATSLRNGVLQPLATSALRWG